MVLLIPFAKPRFNRYLTRWYGSYTTAGSHESVVSKPN